ncbi:WXG100 family type VII secretion target [Mycobacterium sp. 050128]|uniref:WXG100 family type VII secretion target n=1 Tax=Mycobacterium sp. 050128 TaxID=3096112 RepID=UPI002EDA6909
MSPFGENLDVVPGLVFHAATEGRGQHEELAVTYASTQSQGWDAEGGWVGSSAVALSGLLDRWQSDATQHHAMLNHHHEGLDAAASGFVDMERDNAQQLSRVYGADPR